MKGKAMPQAVIFDLDGTLADTIEDIAASVNRSLALRGFPTHGIPHFKLMVGNGFKNLVRIALPEAERRDDLVEEMRAEASAYYAEHLVVATRPYPGIPELLAELGKRGLPHAVLSNKPDALAKRLVEAIFPKAGFAFVRGEVEAFPRKPAPDSALDLAARIGLAAGEIVYLGDSDVDMATAQNAGMVAVGAAWGFRGAAELEAAGAKLVIRKPQELLALLEKNAR
jgi:phosphoglycolate phosphatase